MEELKENKVLQPASNKVQVIIKMKAHRAMTGVVVDKNGYATVDADVAKRLVDMHYADYV